MCGRREGRAEPAGHNSCCTNLTIGPSFWSKGKSWCADADRTRKPTHSWSSSVLLALRLEDGGPYHCPPGCRSGVGGQTESDATTSPTPSAGSFGKAAALKPRALLLQRRPTVFAVGPDFGCPAPGEGEGSRRVLLRLNSSLQPRRPGKAGRTE